MGKRGGKKGGRSVVQKGVRRVVGAKMVSKPPPQNEFLGFPESGKAIFWHERADVNTQ